MIPTIIALFYSLVSNITDKKYVGITNYIEIFKQESFQLAIGNTLKIFTYCVIVTMMLAVVLAYILQIIEKLNIVCLILFSVPTFIPSGTMVSVWRLFFGSNGVLIKYMVILGIDYHIVWKSFPYDLVVLLIYIWRYLGIVTFILYIGMLTIPKVYYEEANMDGANLFSIFIRITLPLMKRNLIVAFVFNIVCFFKVYRDIYLLYGSYPSKKIYLIQHYINNQFININYTKLSCAAFIIVIILLCVLKACEFGIRGNNR